MRVSRNRCEAVLKFAFQFKTKSGPIDEFCPELFLINSADRAVTFCSVFNSCSRVRPAQTSYPTNFYVPTWTDKCCMGEVELSFHSRAKGIPKQRIDSL